MVGAVIGACVLLVAGRAHAASVAGAALAYRTDSPEDIADYLNAHAQANARWLAAHPDAPCCASCAGLRYVGPTMSAGMQRVKRADALLASGCGTCADLAAFDAGAKLAHGEAAEVEILATDDPRVVHAVVRLADGTLLDPAAEAQACSRCR